MAAKALLQSQCRRHWRPTAHLIIAAALLFVAGLPVTHAQPDDWQLNTVDGGIAFAQGVRAADLDGDGDLDFIAASADASVGLRWWVNDGTFDGSWGPEHSIPYSGSSGFYDVQPVDLDEDGDIDLVAGAFNEDEWVWFENTNGLGTAWTEHLIVDGWNAPSSVWPADVDGDGDLDVVGTANYEDWVVWFENSGDYDQEWQGHTIINNWNAPWDAQAHDFDNDGDLDIVTCSDGDPDEILVFLNEDGAANFGDPHTVSSVPLHGSYKGISVGDINGDGYLDIVSGNAYAETLVFFNDGTGTGWTLHTDDTYTPHAYYDSEIADMDGDGDNDIIVCDDIILYNDDGSGTSWTADDPSYLQNARGVAVADMDGDTDLDVLVAEGTGIYSGVHLLLQPGGPPPDPDLWYTDTQVLWEQGSPPVPRTIFVMNHGGDPFTFETSEEVDWLSISPATGTVEGGDTLEVTVTFGEFPGNLVETGFIWFTAQDIGFAQAVFFHLAAAEPGPWEEYSLAVDVESVYDMVHGDVDGDGDNDLIGATTQSPRGVFWWENQDGGASWTTHVLHSNVTNYQHVAAADFDGDGDLDVTFNTTDLIGRVAVLLNDGDGNSWMEVEIVNGYEDVIRLQTGDMDNDGDEDIIALNRTGGAQHGDPTWWENLDGDGQSWTAHVIDEDLGAPSDMVVGDLDSDGDLDVCASWNGGQNGGWMRWWENLDGTGTSWSDLTSTGHTVRGAANIHLEDIDADGDLDAFVASAYEGFNYGTYLLRNENADASSWSLELIDNGEYANGAIQTADFDDDGDLDLVQSDVSSFSVSLWTNEDGTGSTWSFTLLEGITQTPHSPVAVDIDGDTDADIAVGHGTGISWFRQPGSPSPALSVDPLQLDLTWEQGDPSPTAEITVSNSGAGIMDWTAAENADWLAIAPEAGSLTAGESATVSVVLEGNPGQGSYADVISISAPAIPSTVDVQVTLAVTYQTFAWEEHPVEQGLQAVYSVHCADVDGDDDSDIIASYDDALSWWRNVEGDGVNFFDNLLTDDVLDGRFYSTSGDIDGDGDEDIVVSHRVFNDVRWYENIGGDAELHIEHIITADINIDEIAVVDIDGDADGDLLATPRTGSLLRLFENLDGEGLSWDERPISMTGNAVSTFAAGDLDGDGDTDAVYSRSGGDGELFWLENVDGHGEQWQDHLILDVNGTYILRLDISDFNEDGHPDIGFGRWFQTDAEIEVGVLLHQGGTTPSWTEQHVVSVPGTGIAGFSIADLTGSEAQDIAFIRSGGDLPQTLYVMINAGGSGTNWLAREMMLAFEPLHISAADMDSDGDQDLVTTTVSEGSILWFEQPGTPNPPPLVDIALDADEPVVVPLGGLFSYGVSLSSNLQQPQQIDIWTEAILPNGNPYGPIWLIENFPIMPGTTIEANPLYQAIPLSANPGNYGFRIRTGNYPNLVLDSDEFAFEITSNPRAGIASGEWTTWEAWGIEDAFEYRVSNALAEAALPESFDVSAAYPNPFNPTAEVTVSLPVAATLTVAVYNVMGQQVAEVAHGQFQAGYHILTLDGSTWASGIYFVRTTVPGKLDNLQKLSLLK